MRSIEIPVWAPWGQAPELVSLTSALRVDARPGLIALWSWSAVHPGAHPAGVWEAIADWRGTPGSLAAALVATGWATEADGLVSLVNWRDLLGSDADERPEERKRRLSRERSRRYRESKAAPSRSVTLHHASVTQSVTLHHASVTPASRDITLASRSVTLRHAPDDGHSLSLGFQKEKEPEEEEEERNVVSIAQRDVSSPPLAGPSGAAPRPVSVTATPTLFALTPPSASTAPTADGRERPVVGPGSTNDAEVRSVPVEGSDRAPEGDSGRRTKKGRGGRKASVDPAAVDAPVRQVWEAYAEAVKTRVVLSKERADLIAARLADGWTADELVEAIKGYGTSAFHFGQNQQGTRYTSIELWLRDAAHVEQGLGYRRTPAQPLPNPAASKYPPRGGIEDKFARYFAEQRAAGLAEEDL